MPTWIESDAKQRRINNLAGQWYDRDTTVNVVENIRLDSELVLRRFGDSDQPFADYGAQARVRCRLGENSALPYVTEYEAG